MAQPIEMQQWAYVLYADPGEVLWHQRYVLGTVACSVPGTVIATPDHDVYLESLCSPVADIAAVRWNTHHRPSPPGLRRARVYRFGAVPTQNRLDQYYIAAEAVAAEAITEQLGARAVPVTGAFVRFTPGLAGAIVPPLPPPAAPPAPSDGGRIDSPRSFVGDAHPAAIVKWVAVESIGGYSRGEEVTLNGAEVIKGHVGLHRSSTGEYVAIRNIHGTNETVYKGQEAGGDARLLNLLVSGNTRVRRQWREVVPLMSEVSFGDWPITGPRTVLWCCRFLDRRNGGPWTTTVGGSPSTS